MRNESTDELKVLLTIYERIIDLFHESGDNADKNIVDTIQEIRNELKKRGEL